MKISFASFTYLKENFLSAFGFIVLAISLFGLVSWIYFNEEHQDFLVWTVAIEGVLLFIILVLYIVQLQKIKAINKDKDDVLDLLENRMAAIEAAADGIGVFDPDGKLIYYNKALKELHGIPLSEEDFYIGQSWLSLYNEAGQDEIEKNVLPYLYEHKYWRGSSFIERKDGQYVHADMTLTLLADGSFIGTARDITEQQKALDEKKELEQQFYQAQKMEAVGRLAGGMAHDFNNVLAAIRGYSEFLYEDLSDRPNEKKYAQNILKACTQAKELIDQILAFSRQKQSTKDAIDLVDSVQESISLLKASIPRTIEIVDILEVDKAFIDGNPTQISQVIMNLCVNSKDAMDEEHGEIKLHLKLKDLHEFSQYDFLFQEGEKDERVLQVSIEDVSPTKTQLLLGALNNNQQYVSLKISDTGSGMSRTIMEQVFEPFFTTKPIGKGTGLGLSMVHGVIGSHDGALVLESELGVGTNFELLFPIVEFEADSQVTLERSAFEKQTGRILLVEDQEDVQNMMIAMVERMGFEVDACSSGLEALEVIRDGADYYDLIITDQNMPKMTGLEMVYQINMINEKMPFILVSGYSLDRMQDMIKEHPAIKTVLRKPVAMKKLEEKMHLVLQQKNSIQ